MEIVNDTKVGMSVNNYDSSSYSSNDHLIVCVRVNNIDTLYAPSPNFMFFRLFDCIFVYIFLSSISICFSTKILKI